MSWAAHEFENYFIQKHAGIKISFLALMIGTLSPDLFTKAFIYQAEDSAMFHRGWPGVGFSHSLIFGVALGLLVLWITRSRSWALGILIGQWAHVLTDISDTAGVMLFFPFSTEPITISMWRHAAAEGAYGDAAAYYSGLGGLWDFFWFIVTIVFAHKTLSADYFRKVIVPADPKAWAWLNRYAKLGEKGSLILYRGIFFYGAARMVSWFLYARFGAKTPFQPVWNGPTYITSFNDLSDAGPLEVLWRSAIGAVLLAGFLYLVWKLVGARLWRRGVDPPLVKRTRTFL